MTSQEMQVIQYGQTGVGSEVRRWGLSGVSEPSLNRGKRDGRDVEGHDELKVPLRHLSENMRLRIGVKKPFEPQPGRPRLGSNANPPDGWLQLLSPAQVWEKKVKCLAFSRIREAGRYGIKGC